MSETASTIPASLERITDLLLEAHAIAQEIDDHLLQTVLASGLLHTGHRLAEHMNPQPTGTDRTQT